MAPGIELKGWGNGNLQPDKLRTIWSTQSFQSARSQNSMGDNRVATETSLPGNSDTAESTSKLSVLFNFGKSVESLFSRKSSEAISNEFSQDENKERGNWSGRLDFLLACIGFAVGLGNVWRFPYLCYRNGGGAFLIPYAIMLGLAGLPLFFMELALGQFASLGPIGVWNISPLFKGLGWAMVTISALVCIYYNIIISYVVFYFFASFGSQVPWATCDNAWNTPACTTSFKNVNQSLFSGNDTAELTEALKPKSPSEEYWERRVLDMSGGIDDMGSMSWRLTLCLLFSWVVVFLCLSKGIKSSGKVVYFTATFPYVVLLILLIRGVTLPGAMDGIRFYIVPDWSKLLTAKVWGDAAVQIFYSLGPAWGGLIVMASFNRFHNNCYRDALIVAITNCGTSVFAGFVIFSVIGFMAHKLHLPVDQVTDSGPGLAFVAYPAGIAMMPGAPFWAILFFFMLFTLGLDSMFAMMETIITALADEYPKYLRTHKTAFTGVTCLLFFLLGLPMCSQGGIYLMNLMDWYCGNFSLLIVALLEILVIMHIYGYHRFSEDIQNMIGFKPNVYWQITWTFVTPMAIVFIVLFNAYQYAPVTYNDYQYPGWAEALGWLMTAASLVWIPICACAVWIKHIGGVRCIPQYIQLPWTSKTLSQLVAASPNWGPALKEHWVFKHAEVSTQIWPGELEDSAPGVQTAPTVHTGPAAHVNNAYHSTA